MKQLYRVTYYWKASFEVEADSKTDAYREVDSDLQMMDDEEFADIMDFCKAEAEVIGSASKKPSKPTRRAPASKSSKLRYFKPGMKPEDMAEAVAEELIKAGLDKEGYPGFEPEPNWDVYNDCYYYFDSGEEEDFAEWADAVRPKCPKAAAMIEEAIRIFNEDGSFEAQAELYERLRAMQSPASGGRKAPKGRGSTGKAGAKPAGRSAPRSNAPKGKAPKKATAPKKSKGARK